MPVSFFLLALLLPQTEQGLSQREAPTTLLFGSSMQSQSLSRKRSSASSTVRLRPLGLGLERLRLRLSVDTTRPPYQRSPVLFTKFSAPLPRRVAPASRSGPALLYPSVSMASHALTATSSALVARWRELNPGAFIHNTLPLSVLVQPTSSPKI